MSKATWADVSAGDVIELKGKPYTVLKLKAKGKLAKVTVTSPAGTFKSEVKLKHEVKLAPLRKGGKQQRWAKPDEAQLGDRLWDTPADKIERRLDKLLGAQLVGESVDGGASYYVPPVDASTIAAHLALFHGVNVHELTDDAMVAVHDDEHTTARSGRPADALTIDHRHTETRPNP